VEEVAVGAARNRSSFQSFNFIGRLSRLWFAAGRTGVAAKQSDRLEASLADDGRYRLLVEAVTDYAIYMLDPAGIVSSWNPHA
jgi:hypothetical protein